MAIRRARRCRLRAVRAEQPFEQTTRIGNRRQRLRFGLPREVVGVGARVAAVAVARLARLFQPDLERGQPGLAANRLRRDLIGGNPELEIGAGSLQDLHARHVRPEGAPVIARAVLQRAPPVRRQVRQDQEFILHGFERREDARQDAERSLGGRRPVPHVDAVRQVEPGEAHRPGGSRAGEGGGHRVEERQADGRAQSLENGPPRQGFPGDDH
jgi:hypothetical protein